MTDFDTVIEQAKAEVLPFESWERLQGESSPAFAAFCAYRDFGMERNIRKAVESALAKASSLATASGEKDKAVFEKRYRMWRNWSKQFRWRERAADFDNYIEKLKAAELRKTIEAQGEKHRAVTGKMLDVVSKKLDTMNPEDLTQGTVTEWVNTAIKAEREAAGLVTAGSKTEPKQGELSFVSDFQGL
ncbi:MAG: hypothetical protein LBU99_06675 [Spirochaetaceae bacterium]|jgi:hypothetical protein|nr:hypothetical protein [Spirochaetaceae bacterium]